MASQQVARIADRLLAQASPAWRRFPAVEGASRAGSRAEWRLAEMAGRLSEICGRGGSAALTLAFRAVLDAQRQQEIAAWVTGPRSCFFPPDAAAAGVDLDALAVARVPDAPAIGRAADHLARSGAFGLVVLDVGSAEVPTPMLSRLLGLAQKHGTAILFLTEKPARAPSLSSLVSLRGEASRSRIKEGRAEGGGSEGGRFRCELHIVKDKRRARAWSHAEVCRGPAGLR
ncbi:MAG: recombinase A [Acidobacteria bacterium]|nr:recombinase A [Acidobacteriota bacterium]